MFNEVNSLTGSLVQTLFEGQKAMTDQAMKQVSVNMQAQMDLQQQQTALQTVAMMTGIGTQVDTTV
ncbi:MAG: hypothetical protein LBP55_06205 [Candidatus Adiutrix sp.]|jgi:hypothetical protein|nr:hypothetical protein [Candidatus Adiutrix sp.]